MDDPYVRIIVSLIAALACGGLIGLERSHRGRLAGLREHALVCLSAALLMLIGVFEWQGGAPALRPFDANASRIIQGVMSGIGFLGAGGIIRDGFSVRGLTTAASIWTTAAIGTMIGVGFWFPAFLTTLLTLGALTIMRWLEGRMRNEHELSLHLRQNRAGALQEAEIVTLLRRHGFKTSPLSAFGVGDGRYLDYKATLTTRDMTHGSRLIATLAADARFVEFGLTPLE